MKKIWLVVLVAVMFPPHAQAKTAKAKPAKAPSSEEQLVEAVAIKDKHVKGSPQCYHDSPDKHSLCDCTLTGEYPHLKSAKSSLYQEANEDILAFIKENDTTRDCAVKSIAGDTTEASYVLNDQYPLVSLRLSAKVSTTGAKSCLYTHSRYLNIDTRTGQLVTLDKVADAQQIAEIRRKLSALLGRKVSASNREKVEKNCLDKIPDFTLTNTNSPNDQHRQTGITEVLVCPTTEYGCMAQSKNGLDLKLPVTFFTHTKYFLPSKPAH